LIVLRSFRASYHATATTPSRFTDLGIDGIWLMPIFQSPSDHGYDTVDYETIEQDYGSNADFQRFLDEAHKRGIRVILDFVMNHTSSEHPWFIVQSQRSSLITSARDSVFSSSISVTFSSTRAPSRTMAMAVFAWRAMSRARGAARNKPYGAACISSLGSFDTRSKGSKSTMRSGLAQHYRV
jgi:hypothetical protein